MKVVLFLIELGEQYGCFGVQPALMTLPLTPSLIRFGRGN